MNTTRIQAPLAGLVALAAVLAAPLAQASAQEGQREETAPQEQQEMQQEQTGQQGDNLVAVARGTSELSLFVQAVEAAGLRSELERNGPYTIFAPTDEAFRSQFGQEDLDRLLNPASDAARDAGEQAEGAAREEAGAGERDPYGEQAQQPGQAAGAGQDELLRVVRAHIVSGEWTSDDLQGITSLQDVLGRSVAVQGGQGTEQPTTAAREEGEAGGETETAGEQPGGEAEPMARTGSGEFSYGGARVVEADLRASNGVIHVIDAVVQPVERTPETQGQEQEAPQPQEPEPSEPEGESPEGR